MASAAIYLDESGDLGWTKHHDGHGRDQGIRGEYSKYHIPLQTNDQCVSRMWDDQGNKRDFYLEVGKVYHIDNERLHESWNHGQTDRIHLVIEVYD